MAPAGSGVSDKQISTQLQGRSGGPSKSPTRSWGLKLQGFPNLCPHLGGLESSLLLQGDLEAQPDLASGHNPHHSPGTALASPQMEVLRVLALVGF